MHITALLRIYYCKKTSIKYIEHFSKRNVMIELFALLSFEMSAESISNLIDHKNEQEN